MAGRISSIVLIAALLAPVAHADLPGKAGLGAALAERWERALEFLPTDKLAQRSEVYFRGVALMETGRIPAGLRVFESLSTTNGSFNGPALEKLVDYDFARRNYEGVIGRYQSTKAKRFLDPSNLNYRVGQSYFLVGEYEKAKPLLSKVELGRLYPYARYTLAQIAFTEGDVSKAIEYLDNGMDGLTSHPDRSIRRRLADQMRLMRGRLVYHAAVSSEDMSENQRTKLFKLAISQLSLIREKSPLYGEALRTIGWCATETGDMVRALASFETATVFDPEKAHEDHWSIGKVLERNGYYEEAAGSYSAAREVAEEWAVTWEIDSQGDVPLTAEELSSEWSALRESIAGSVEKSALLARERITLTAEAADYRGVRLDNVEKGLEKAKAKMEVLTEELKVMDKDLYRYLDVIQIGALFPKKDRPWVESLMDRQEKLLSIIAWNEKAMQTLRTTRSWQTSSDFSRAKAETLWAKLQKKRASLAHAQLNFLEGLKIRVSVREKELMRILNTRKEESIALGEPYDEGVVTLARERKKLAKLKEKIALLDERMAKAGAEIEKLGADIAARMVEEARSRLVAKVETLKLRADQFALDEAQALHLLQNELDKSGE